ncbi:MAG: VWA domain-containing protein [Clostridiales bacterium]|nr:VWA domain-containing protein [Clostridiales bacterium]
MSNLYVEHNALDSILFYDLINSSVLLKRYQKEGTHHFDDFDSLLQDVFHIHFKHTIYLARPISITVNYEIIHEMLQISQILSLRKRTVGSLYNTYLAFKLIIDGLFESLRGRSLIQDIVDTLDTLNTMNALKGFVDKLMEMSVTIDLKSILSKNEQTLLIKYVELLNDNNTISITENKWFKSLIDELYNDSEPLGKTLFQKAIKTALDRSTIEENSSALETLLENLLSQQEDELNNDALEAQTEIEKNDRETSDDFKEHLKDELEEKFAPYLKEQFLSKGQKHPSQKRLISELDTSDPSNKNIIRDGKTSTSEQAIQHTVHKISSTQENRLRQKQFGHSSTTDLSSHIKIPFSDDDFKLLEKNLKTMIKKLNLPRIFSQAIESVDAFNNTTKILGIKENSLDNLTFDEIIKMHKRYIQPSFVKFVNKVGKNKLYASRIQYKKKKEHSIPIDKINSSHNLDLLIEDEYIGLALGIEAFENDFYDRYLRDDLLTIDMIRKYDKRKGPIILCYDGSGSMEGAKIHETQSHILAIIEIAKIQKRHLVLIQFASASEPLYIKEINPSKITAQDVLDVLDEFICGGTDFEKPLSKAIEFIKADQHKKSDILFITDGQCEIREAFKKTFLQLKKQRDFKLYTIIMHAYTYHDYGDIGDISDEVLEIKGRDIGNWNEATNKKLYSLI